MCDTDQYDRVLNNIKIIKYSVLSQQEATS